MKNKTFPVWTPQYVLQSYLYLWIKYDVHCTTKMTTFKSLKYECIKYNQTAVIIYEQAHVYKWHLEFRWLLCLWPSVVRTGRSDLIFISVVFVYKPQLHLMSFRERERGKLGDVRVAYFQLDANKFCN